MQKTTHVFPIIGGRKVEHLEMNIEALNISLSEEQVKYIESVLPFEPGFPHNFCVSPSLLRCMWIQGRGLTLLITGRRF